MVEGTSILILPSTILDMHCVSPSGRDLTPWSHARFWREREKGSELSLLAVESLLLIVRAFQTTLIAAYMEEEKDSIHQ